MSAFIIHEGDVAVRGKQLLTDRSFDACLCDPPYGFTAFTKMKTQAWEMEDVPSDILWHEIFRAMRPGAILMAATGSRMYHRIASAIERAGFEIKDQFNWIYNGANATGVTEGYRLRPAVEPYVVAVRPRDKRGLRGVLNTSGALVEDHLPTNLGMSQVFLDPIDGRNTFGWFFCGKAPLSERKRVPTDHPTLKPLALTEHLARLLHQPGAKRILVPFSGVGSEVIGCLRAGWQDVVGIEREKKYVSVSRMRIPAFCPDSEVA